MVLSSAHLELEKRTSHRKEKAVSRTKWGWSEKMYWTDKTTYVHDTAPVCLPELLKVT